jgi:hypothetical protein
VYLQVAEHYGSSQPCFWNPNTTPCSSQPTQNGVPPVGCAWTGWRGVRMVEALWPVTCKETWRQVLQYFKSQHRLEVTAPCCLGCPYVLGPGGIVGDEGLSRLEGPRLAEHKDRTERFQEEWTNQPHLPGLFWFSLFSTHQYPRHNPGEWLQKNDRPKSKVETDAKFLVLEEDGKRAHAGFL